MGSVGKIFFPSNSSRIFISLHSLLIFLFLFSSSLLLISFHLTSSSRLLLPSSLDISSSLILFHLTFFSSLLISSHLLLVSSNLISPSSRLNQGSTTVTQAAQCSCVSPTAIVLHISIRWERSRNYNICCSGTNICLVSVYSILFYSLLVYYHLSLYLLDLICNIYVSINLFIKSWEYRLIYFSSSFSTSFLPVLGI